MNRKFIQLLALGVVGLSLFCGLAAPVTKVDARPVGSFLQGGKANTILAMITPMRITEAGVLEYLDVNTKTYTSAGLIESHRHLIYPYSPVKRVDFLIIHYDTFPNLRSDGKPGTVQNTVANLNDGRMASIHYCVDSYPISSQNKPGMGMGVLMATQPAALPYRARHTAISVSLENGVDPNSQQTAELMEKLGILNKLSQFNLDKKKDMDAVSIGIEQSGNDFSKHFPLNMPPEREIANLLSLIIAASHRYSLKIWDILGHNEIQQKPDPGYEYMTILRLLLARLYFEKQSLFPKNFLGVEAQDFYDDLKQYASAAMGEQNYEKVLDWLEIAEPNVLPLRGIEIKKRRPCGGALFGLY
ncbi:MAG: N-acetylmuramoyl-L-alanine amidase [Anaerolineaceae bacterium]|nr:N-acetylmuramoyl-L-alanine amidase [Anaerolineaceae bacterium]